MRKEGTLEEWKRLYDIAIKIKELKPWEHLCDLDIITLELPNREPIWASIMGKGGEFYGVGVYIGNEAIWKFNDMIEKEDVPPEQRYRYHDNNIIMCYFGNRDELSSKELKLIKDLGLKFRGKNNWIYFHSFKKGYAPYLLNKEEVLLETEILEHIYMSLKANIEHNLNVNFEKGNTLLRTYNPDQKLWMNFEAPIKIPKKQYTTPTLTNDVLISKLKKLKTNNNTLEIDIAYLGSTINDKNYERPINMRMGILSERKTGMIINQNILSPDDDDTQEIFNLLIPTMMEQDSKPRKIMVRDEYIYYILMDLCKRVNIQVEINGKLNVIDRFIREFSSHRI